MNKGQNFLSSVPNICGINIQNSTEIHSIVNLNEGEQLQKQQNTWPRGGQLKWCCLMNVRNSQWEELQLSAEPKQRSSEHEWLVSSKQPTQSYINACQMEHMCTTMQL